MKAGYLLNTKIKQAITRKKAMSAIIKFVAPGELLLQPGTEEKHPRAIEKENAVQQPRSIGEPEQRLWKLSTRATSPTSATIEVFVLVLFLMLAFAAIVSCFAELSRLLEATPSGMSPRRRSVEADNLTLVKHPT